jgi:hypothetical protein
VSAAEHIGAELRHYCRNSHCRAKLPTPVESPHKAFCCRGCFESFYRTRCLVCEKPKHHPRRQLCGHINCKKEKARFPHLFTLAWTVEVGSEVPVNRALNWLSGSLRGFGWAETDCDTFSLIRRDASVAAVVRRAEAGDCWWVARPRAIPEPPVESLEDAKRRAVSMALWALPPFDAKRARAARKLGAAP